MITLVSNDDSLVSDVQNIDTIDLDNYYIGCDSRISKSSTITNEMIKYRINTQNTLIVQRYLSLLGSGAIGDVLIEYSDTDAVKYGVALNGAIDSYKSILKTISDSQFDYTENNATINGWIFDYFKKDNDIYLDYTVVSGGADVPNVYDDDITSYLYFRLDNVGWATVLEVSFPSKTIIEAHLAIEVRKTEYTHYAILELKVDGVWTNISGSLGGGSPPVWYGKHYDDGWSLVTGFRIRVYRSNISYHHNTWVYDCTLFE